MKRNSSFQLPQLKPVHRLQIQGDRRAMNKSLDLNASRQVCIRVRQVKKTTFGLKAAPPKPAKAKYPGLLPSLPLVGNLRSSYSGALVTVSQLKLMTSAQSSSDEDSEVLVYPGLCYEVLNLFVDFFIQQVIHESFFEITCAALRLHSNSLLDRLIQEFVNSTAEEIVVYSIDELKNYDLFEMGEKILETVCEDLTKKICDECVMEKFALILAVDVLDCLDFDCIVVQSVQEEIFFCNLVLQLTAAELVEEILMEEWIEVLVEDQVSHAKILQNFKILPGNIQKELFDDWFSRKDAEVAEEIYFEMLDGYVGGLWTRNVAEAVFGGLSDLEETVLMPCHVDTRRKRDTYLAEFYLTNLHTLR